MPQRGGRRPPASPSAREPTSRPRRPRPAARSEPPVLGNVVRRVAERFRAEQVHAAHDDVPCPGGTAVRHGSAVAPDVDPHLCLHSIVTRSGRKLPVGLRGYSRTLAHDGVLALLSKSYGAGISCAPEETLAFEWQQHRGRRPADCCLGRQAVAAQGPLVAVPLLPHPLPNLRVLLQIDPVQLLELRLVGRIPVRRTRRQRDPPPPIQPLQRPQRRRLRLRRRPDRGCERASRCSSSSVAASIAPLPVTGADSCRTFHTPPYVAVARWCGWSG